MTTTRALTAAVGALACLFAGSVAHAQGVTKTNILIGQSSPFSGSNKELGDDIREGLQAYFKRTNEAGRGNRRNLRAHTRGGPPLRQTSRRERRKQDIKRNSN